MFLKKSGDFLSGTSLSYGNSALRAMQKFSYGFSDRFSAAADIKYQLDFDGDEDGFSNVGLSGVYRLSTADEDTRIISDVLFGINFGGSTSVREPDFADTIYHAGVRVGRQWNVWTLAGTIKTSWIFDEIRGMAYVDFIPEIYARINQNWMTGVGFDFRKSTNPNFDASWINLNLIRQYGRTQYIAHIDHEFENSDWQFGLKINVLF
jgi:hypothetical protein